MRHKIASGPPAVVRADPAVIEAYLGVEDEDDDVAPAPNESAGVPDTEREEEA